MINATPVTVKQLIAYSTEKLLFINNSPILLRPPEKNLCKQPLTPSEIASFWKHTLLRISVALRGERGGGWGMDSFWNYTFFLFTLQGNETTNGGADNHLCADNIQIPAASSITYFCRPKVYGRYLYIRIPGSNKMLTLCEVEVYSLSKSVNLSSCLFCRYAWCLCVHLFFAFY